jgi:hypothetical protein
VLANWSTILGLFKILWLEFDEVATLMVPTIQAHARFMDEVDIVIMWPTKLNTNQRLLEFIMFLKHDNVVMYDAFTWN